MDSRSVAFTMSVSQHLVDGLGDRVAEAKTDAASRSWREPRAIDAGRRERPCA